MFTVSLLVLISFFALSLFAVMANKERITALIAGRKGRRAAAAAIKRAKEAAAAERKREVIEAAKAAKAAAGRKASAKRSQVIADLFAGDLLSSELLAEMEARSEAYTSLDAANLARFAKSNDSWLTYDLKAFFYEEGSKAEAAIRDDNFRRNDPAGYQRMRENVSIRLGKQ